MKKFRMGILFVAALFSNPALSFAQGTAFTYQGRLTAGGAPATGLYDFQFTVRDMPLAGNGVGVFPLTATLPVTNGLFTVMLDPGPGVFTGPPRWLDISVRTNGGGTYSNLSPRQLLTATPYAVRATGAAIASGVTPGAVTAAGLAPGAVHQVGNPSGTISNALQVNAGGLIGIGTNSPQAGLHIATGNTILAPRVLSVLRDEVGGYTNLAGPYSTVVLGNLLAIGTQTDNGVTLVDISNPEAPSLISQIQNGNGTFTNFANIYGLAMKTNLLVTSSLEEEAVTLIGITNPASPVKLAELIDGVGGWNEIMDPYSVAVRGNVLAIASLADSAVTLADISNPSAPINRVVMKDGTFGFNSISGAVSVAISGNLLAIGSFFDNAVTLVDITDISSPIKLSEIKDGVGGFNNLSSIYHVAFSPDGTLLSIVAAYGNSVTLVSVTNPASPVKLSQLMDGSGGVNYLAVPTSSAFSGNQMAVTSGGESAITVFDISNPTAPQVRSIIRDGVGGFDYLEGLFSVTFAGSNMIAGGLYETAVSIIGNGSATAGLVTENRVGIGTTTPRAALDVVGDVIVDSATYFDVNAEKIELGVGASAAGTNAVAIGNNVRALGTGATALGGVTRASGEYSTALGYASVASGRYSLAAGNTARAFGDFSVALGNGPMATGENSFALGLGSMAQEDLSYAFAGGEAAGFSSFAFGGNTHANGIYSIVMGLDSTANFQGGLALGLGNIADGEYGVAIGRFNYANSASMALGSYANATHTGTFIWADDSTPSTFTSTGNGQFLVRASDGVGINTNNPGPFSLHVHGPANIHGTVSATNFVGRFTGNGAGLTNLPSAGNYLFTYDTGIQTIPTAPTFQDVVFAADAQINGWTHTSGQAGFTNAQAGLYLIEYTAHVETTAAGIATVSIRGTLNNNEIVGSHTVAEPDVAGQVVTVSKSFIVSAPAGQVLRLQVTGSGAASRLINNVGNSSIRPSVSMTAIRIQ